MIHLLFEYYCPIKNYILLIEGGLIALYWFIQFLFFIKRYLFDEKLNCYITIIKVKGWKISTETFDDAGDVAAIVTAVIIICVILAYLWPLIPVALLVYLGYLLLRGIRFIIRLTKELNTKSKF